MFDRSPNQEKGSVVIIVALLMTVLLGFCAFVVDIGMLYIQQQKFQNAVDATVLAAAQELPDTISATDIANQYIELNGFSLSDISLSFLDGNDTIKITGTKTVNYYLAKALGFNNATVHVSASAMKGDIPDAFNYALFSGSSTATLSLNGSNQNIVGSSHANKNFSANGSKLNITGACEAVSSVSVNGSQINIGNIVQNAPYIDMPDFSDQVKNLAEAAGQSYLGDRNYNGNNIELQSPIYVTGNLTINGSHFSGKGTIVATGNITFNGSNLYDSSNDAVCFYSKNGNIIINGSNAVLSGIVYAPNGTITMNGSNQTVYGRVIGEQDTINGSSLNIISSTNDYKSLPLSGVKLIK